MNFGFILPHNWGLEDPDDVIDLAVRAEELGFDSVWVNHHVLNVGYIRDRLDDKPYYDTLTVLTWVAAVTRRVRLGTTVLVLPYLNPIVLAKSLATLDVMSRGRLTVGVGVGGLEMESDALGSDYRTRGRYTNESIEIMRELWSSVDPSYQGEFYSFDGARISPRPLQQPGPPILVGGGSRAALRRAATLGDGWHPTGISPDQLATPVESLYRIARDNGRDPSRIIVSVRNELDVTEGSSSGAGSAMSGSPDQLLEAIDAYEAQGVSELVLAISTADVERIRRVQELFAERVMRRHR